VPMTAPYTPYLGRATSAAYPSAPEFEGFTTVGSSPFTTASAGVRSRRRMRRRVGSEPATEGSTTQALSLIPVPKGATLPSVPKAGRPPVGSRSGPVTWVAAGSSVLSILVVVLLGTRVITPPGGTTDFDTVTRRMGIHRTSVIAVPPAIEDDLSFAGLPRQTAAGDILMYLETYVVMTPGTARPRPPTLSPDVVRWVCGNIGGDFLYAGGRRLWTCGPADDSRLARLRTHDALGLHPTSFDC
jgi:hypothetical protein